MSRKQKSRKFKKPRTQAISDSSINDDHCPVEVAIPENDQLISPLTEVVNDPLSELEDIINNKKITATPLPTPSNRKMIFPIKPLYFLYFMVGVVLFFQLTTVDFVRSTGIHANGNSATNNKSQTSKSTDPGALDNLINNSALTVPDSDIYSVIASDGSTFIQQRSRDLVNIPQQRPNPIQLLSFQIKNKLNCFVKKISNFFRNLFSFLSPSSSSLSSPTEKNRLEQPQSQSQDNRSTSITTRSSSTELVPDYRDIVWAGKPITPKEIEGIKQLRHLIEQNQSKLRSKWSHSIHNIELLRFLRAKHHHVQHAWKGIQHHDEYRISEFGPESSFMWNSYDHSPLLMEGFWLDYNEVGCPTLVIRTQLHDGYYYNDDPKIYAAYLVRLLEEGRRRFNVGIDHQLCVLMDRAGTVYKNGKKKVDKLDMGVIPGLVQLFRHVYSTLTENYPDVLDSCRIAPASKFFSACYRITSRVMAPQYREKFQILEADELSKKLHSWVNKKYLPEHLGGVNQPPYQSVVNIDFDPHKSKFPINSKRRRKQVAEDQDLFHHEEITEESKK